MPGFRWMGFILAVGIRWKQLLVFCVEGSPHGVGGVADAIPFKYARREETQCAGDEETFVLSS